MKRLAVLTFLFVALAMDPSALIAQDCTPGTVPVWNNQGQKTQLGCSQTNLNDLLQQIAALQQQVQGLQQVQSLQQAQNAKPAPSQKGKGPSSSQPTQSSSGQDMPEKEIKEINNEVLAGSGTVNTIALWRDHSTTNLGKGLIIPGVQKPEQLIVQKWTLGDSALKQDPQGNLAIGSSPDNQGKLTVTSSQTSAAILATGGTEAAVKGSSTSGRGVQGNSESKGAVVGQSTSGNGVTGTTDSETQGAVVGIGHRAGLFQGNVGVSGTFVVSGLKQFKIDHPLDPANKYLAHASVESSELMNLYTGTVVLDQKGEAVVQLANWFEALNKDFRFQLTAVGTPSPGLYIADKIAHGVFKIAGGKPYSEVSWLVTGIRQDAWANAHPLAVEEEKVQNERGSYLHPELFDQPFEKSAAWLELPEFRSGLRSLWLREAPTQFVASRTTKSTSRTSSKRNSEARDRSGRLAH